ncbi:MAG: hypothetical protein AB7H97_19375 [Pseudobdellovibrionaceae bacterium]
MKSAIVMALVLATFWVTSVFAAEPNVSKEDRQKMADMHTRMAECLKSDKPMRECHSEMMKGCRGMMGKEGCPMMGRRGMMRDQNDEKSDSKE